MRPVANCPGRHDAHALLVEVRSKSTLQNALFTRALLRSGPDTPLVLVTNRYHLPRAWLSFRWAGMRNLTPYPSDSQNDYWHLSAVLSVFEDAAKLLLNLPRAAFASAAGALGIPQSAYIRLLD